MKKRNVIIIGGTVLGLTGIAALLKKKEEDKLKNSPTYHFECTFSHPNQPQAERLLLHTVEELLKNQGKVELLKCVNAEKSDDKLFPEDYIFTFALDVKSTLPKEKLEDLLYYTGDSCILKNTIETKEEQSIGDRMNA